MRFEKCWFYCIPRPRYSIRPERCKDAAELHLFLLDDPASLEDNVERLVLAIFRFCRSKCHKAYRRLHGKDMTEDSTFEFERRRNRPERYDRNLAESTLMAIKKIDKVRTSREARHHTKRMKPKKAKEQTEGERELDQSIHLIKAALQSDPSLILPKIKVNVYQQQSENRLMEE